MQASTRDTLSCMCRHQPTGSHGHDSGPLVKADMVHKFHRGYDSLDLIGYLDRNATVRVLKRVIVTPVGKFNMLMIHFPTSATNITL